MKETMVIANTRTGQIENIPENWNIDSYESYDVQTGIKDTFRKMTIEEAYKIEERWERWEVRNITNLL